MYLDMIRSKPTIHTYSGSYLFRPLVRGSERWRYGCKPFCSANQRKAERTTSRRTILQGTAAGVFCCGACNNGGSGGGPLAGRFGWYDKYFAYGMATSMADYEQEIAPLKWRLFSEAVRPDDQVLELGIGTGPNLRYYAGRQGIAVTGIDINTAMQPYAVEAAEAAGLPPERLNLLAGDVQNLPLDDASFDVVICTLVLCSVPNVAAALSEAQRVLRSGGRLLYIEHVFAPQHQQLLQLQQRLLNPLQRLAADNCHLTRDTGRAIADSGLFSEVNAEPPFELPGMGLIAPHAAGIATV